MLRLRGMLICLAMTTICSAVTAADLLHFDLSQWPIAGWADAREERFPAFGQWAVSQQGITNVIPSGVEEQDIVAMKNGTGMASSVFVGRPARNVTATATMSFERKGAPSILLRAQARPDGRGYVTGQMLSLVLYEAGVNLWRFDGAKWHKAAAEKFEVEPCVFHTLKVRLEGPRARVWLDGKAVMETEDVGLNAPGLVGLWAGEGPCHFGALRLRLAD